MSRDRPSRFTSPATAPADGDPRITQLVDGLPRRTRRFVRWLRRPQSRWLRIPLALALVLGGFLAILPLFGLWMLPLGLILLAEDLPPVRRAVSRGLDWLEERRRRAANRRSMN